MKTTDSSEKVTDNTQKKEREMKKHILISTIALLAVLVTANLAFAGPRGRQAPDKSGAGPASIECPDGPGGPGSFEGEDGKRPPRPNKRMLKRFDTDGDGKLSKAEREKAREFHQKMLEKFDMDGDGKLSKEEREKIRESRPKEDRPKRERPRRERHKRGEQAPPNEL